MRLLLLAAAAALLVLAGCTAPVSNPTTDPDAPRTSRTTTPSSEPTPIAAPPPATPKAGTCHRLSYDEAVAPSAQGGSAPCGKQHTAETFFVGTLDTVVDGRLLAVDSAHVERQVAAACPDRLDGFLGGTEEQQRLSMLRAVWFTPTLRASDAGASWFRCDAVVVSGGGGTLQQLDGSLRGVLATEEGRQRYGLCGTAEPGTKGFQRVVCERPHTWRAVRTVPLGEGDYPGEDRASSAGEDPCREAGRAAASDPLDFQWGYEWPSRSQWQSGRTYGVCWVPD